jgi:long-subunit acyl-CoA synthetase (AMP-forming)
MLALFEHQDHFELTPDDFYLSYLPLPHTFERVVHLAAISGGA